MKPVPVCRACDQVADHQRRHQVVDAAAGFRGLPVYARDGDDMVLKERGNTRQAEQLHGESCRQVLQCRDEPITQGQREDEEPIGNSRMRAADEPSVPQTNAMNIATRQNCWITLVPVRFPSSHKEETQSARAVVKPRRPELGSPLPDRGEGSRRDIRPPGSRDTRARADPSTTTQPWTPPSTRRSAPTQPAHSSTRHTRAVATKAAPIPPMSPAATP